MSRPSLSLALALLTTPFVACSGGAGSGTDTDTDTDEPVPVTCPDPTAGPTVHDTVIEADEVWRAEDGPHLVEQWITIRSGATLTIEPCATVEISEGKGFSVAYPSSPNTGALVAEGEAQRPVVFRGRDGARWGYVSFAPGGTGRFTHTTFENGGGDNVTGATLVIQGDELPTRRDVFVDTVTIRDSLGAGVRVERLGGFADGSKDLVITGSGNEAQPYVMHVDEHAIDSLPRGTYTGNNVRDVIFVDPTSHLLEDTLMKNLGVPYVIGAFAADSLVIGGDERPLTTLTVEPGVRVEFHPYTALEIDHATGPVPAAGVLIAEGTAEAPIVFTSAAAAPAPGDWQGLHYGGIARPENSLKNVHIEYSGADCGCIYVSCSAIDSYEGAVIFSHEPTRAFVEDSVIRHGAGHGVVRGYAGGDIDFREGFTFEDLGGCEQTLPITDECPDPKPACE